MDAKEKMDELISKLETANYEYYVLDNPTLTDMEYDNLMQELIKLELENPSLKRIDSPSNKVGGMVLDKFTKVNHDKPMLSLSNAFSAEDLRDFDEKIQISADGHERFRSGGRRTAG